MLIRTMTMEDVKQVAEIEAQCFSLPWSQKSFEDSLKRDDTIFLVCEQKSTYQKYPVLRDESLNNADIDKKSIRKESETLSYNKENLEKLQNNSELSDKRIIGYIGMYISFEEGEITNVAVTPFARQKGIGNALIKAIKEAARKQNLQRIVLEVRVSNQSAIALYKKNAFVSIGIRKNFYEKPVEDANIMVCEEL